MAHNLLLAQATYHLTGPGVDPTLYASPLIPLEKYITEIVGILTIVGVIYFTLQIIFAGYAMLSSEGDPKKIEVARDRLTQSILGLFIVFVALIFAALVARLAGIENVFDLQSVFSKLTF